MADSRGWSEIGQNLLNNAGEAYIASQFRPVNDPAIQPAVPVASQAPAVNQATQRPWSVAGIEVNKTALIVAGAAVLVAVLLFAVRR